MGEAALKKLTDRSSGMERLELCGSCKEVMASAHENVGENEAEVPLALAAPTHDLLRIVDAAGNAAVAAELPAANDAAGATTAGAGADNSDARSLPFVLGVLPDSENEADAPPVKARQGLSN